MPGMSRRPAADPFRGASFLDRARSIVWRDRALRKAGRSVDTAGAVARALEQAYRLGFEEAQTGQPVRARAAPEAPMAWELLPSRPRKAFWSICMSALGGDASGRRGVRLVPDLTERRGNPGWRISGPDGDRGGTVFGRSSIEVLRRHRLLEAIDADGGHGLGLTERGVATWRMAVEGGGERPPNP